MLQMHREKAKQDAEQDAALAYEESAAVARKQVKNL